MCLCAVYRVLCCAMFMCVADAYSHTKCSCLYSFSRYANKGYFEELKIMSLKTAVIAGKRPDIPETCPAAIRDIITSTYHHAPRNLYASPPRLYIAHQFNSSA